MSPCEYGSFILLMLQLMKPTVLNSSSVIISDNLQSSPRVTVTSGLLHDLTSEPCFSCSRLSRFLTTQTGLTEDKPYLDPCLPAGLSDTVVRDNRTLYLRGQGAWADCQRSLQPFLGLHNGTMSPGGVYQVQLTHSPELHNSLKQHYATCFLP